MKAVERWQIPHDNYIVVLDGGNEDHLMELMDRCVGWCNLDYWAKPLLTDEDYAPFSEPDLNGEHTGFAIKPGKAPKWISNLPLLFKASAAKEVNYND